MEQLESPVVVITQPNYLPWIGYFEQIQRSDIFVFLDNVQFEKREWQNRNRIKELTGRTMWLTVPVKIRGHSQFQINEIEIDYGQNWIQRHLTTIQRNYAKTPFFDEVYGIIGSVLESKPEHLSKLNIDLIYQLASYLSLERRFVRASEMDATGNRTDLLVSLCKQLETKTYYSSQGARGYMENEEVKFTGAGIRVVYQNYEHPVYSQAGPEFTAYLSIVDLLFHHGRDSMKFVKGGR